jgi:hypothetical protein
MLLCLLITLFFSAAAAGSTGAAALKQWLQASGLVTALYNLGILLAALSVDNAGWVGLLAVQLVVNHLWELILMGGSLLSVISCRTY